MPVIQKLVIANLKKFKSIELKFDPKMNVLIGDNEAGKSTILLALDLVLGGSRSRVESFGVETLFCKETVDSFLAGPKDVQSLPVLFVEVYLSEGENHELNGRQNSKQIVADGVKMEIAPIDEYGKAISEVLVDDYPNFPFEYYGIKFSTFSGAPYLSFKRPLRHLSLDSSRIDNEYAVREYTRSVFSSNAEASQRYRLENLYRRGKDGFRDDHLETLNRNLSIYKFGVRSGARANLESDLIITEDNIPIESRGKGRQCFIKTEFALSKHNAGAGVQALLLEEPENHLSHTNMRKLVASLAEAKETQLFVATHSSHICSRLDLRRSLLIGARSQIGRLQDLSEDTADFFMKAPDNNVLEFALSKRVILVEGDAEFILIDAFYRNQRGASAAHEDKVHVIAIGGTSFKRYLELAKLLGIRTAAIRDNDGDHDANCVVNYTGYVFDGGKVFADPDNAKRTFEIALYEENKAICDGLFGGGRRTLSVQDYMLKNKADAALQLLKSGVDALVAPKYIRDAIEWISA